VSGDARRVAPRLAASIASPGSARSPGAERQEHQRRMLQPEEKADAAEAVERMDAPAAGASPTSESTGLAGPRRSIQAIAVTWDGISSGSTTAKPSGVLPEDRGADQQREGAAQHQGEGRAGESRRHGAPAASTGARAPSTRPARRDAALRR